MSDAKKCDRCQKYYEQNGKQREYQITRDVNRNSTTPSYDYQAEDLCDECYESLKEFINGKGLNRETDCRTERDGIGDLATLEVECETDDPPEIPEPWDLISDRIRPYQIDQPKRTVLKEQVDMGARNY